MLWLFSLSTERAFLQSVMIVRAVLPSPHFVFFVLLWEVFGPPKHRRNKHDRPKNGKRAPSQGTALQAGIPIGRLRFNFEVAFGVSGPG